MDSFKSYLLIALHREMEKLGDRLAEIEPHIDWEAFCPIIADLYNNDGPVCWCRCGWFNWSVRWLIGHRGNAQIENEVNRNPLNLIHSDMISQRKQSFALPHSLCRGINLETQAFQTV